MRNSSLVEGSCADNVTGLKSAAEAVESRASGIGRGAFCMQRSSVGKLGGVCRSANARLSSVYVGENPTRRKSKDSYATSVDVGLVGPKLRPQGVSDGQQVKIPAPPLVRLKQRGDTGR